MKSQKRGESKPKQYQIKGYSERFTDIKLSVLGTVKYHEVNSSLDVMLSLNEDTEELERYVKLPGAKKYIGSYPLKPHDRRLFELSNEAFGKKLGVH